MLQNLFSIRHFWLTKWSFLVHSTTRNAPYIHPSHDSNLELWNTFPNIRGGSICNEKRPINPSFIFARIIITFIKRSASWQCTLKVKFQLSSTCPLDKPFSKYTAICNDTVLSKKKKKKKKKIKKKRKQRELRIFSAYFFVW